MLQGKWDRRGAEEGVRTLRQYGSGGTSPGPGEWGMRGASEDGERRAVREADRPGAKPEESPGRSARARVRGAKGSRGQEQRWGRTKMGAGRGIGNAQMRTREGARLRKEGGAVVGGKGAGQLLQKKHGGEGVRAGAQMTAKEQRSVEERRNKGSGRGRVRAVRREGRRGQRQREARAGQRDRGAAAKRQRRWRAASEGCRPARVGGERRDETRLRQQVQLRNQEEGRWG